MFNLIWRDVIMQKKLLLTFIPFIAFFIFMDSHPALIFLVASIFIPFNAYAYDEKAETNILLNSLPYTRKEIIASRYLGALVYMILSIAVTSLALMVSNKTFSLTDIAISVGLFILFVSLTLPMFYIFKPGYITMAIMISFILLAGIGPSIVIFLAEHLTAITDFIIHLSITTIYIAATVVILLVFLLSWGITTAIYQRKAF